MSAADNNLISLELAVSGMVLSEPIADANRDVLLPVGATLTDAAIASLRRRGIVKVSVVVPEAADAQHDAAREIAREMARQRLQQLFRRSSNAATMTLMEHVSRYRQC